MEENNNRNLKQDIAYLAGIIDGEGCLTFSIEARNPRNQYPILWITNSNKRLMNFLKKNFGGNIHKYQNNKKWKPAYAWRVCCQKAINLTKQVFPYLIIKKPQAELFIQFGFPENNKKYYSAEKKHLFLTEDTLRKRKELVNKMRRLNKKGYEK